MNTYIYQPLEYYSVISKISTNPDVGKDLPKLPSMSIDWKYWHAYQASPEKDLPKYDEVKNLWYSGLTYLKRYDVGKWKKEGNYDKVS